MFALKQGNRYKKITGRATRGNDTYNFDTDIVHLGIHRIMLERGYGIISHWRLKIHMINVYLTLWCKDICMQQ